MEVTDILYVFWNSKQPFTGEITGWKTVIYGEGLIRASGGLYETISGFGLSQKKEHDFREIVHDFREKEHDFWEKVGPGKTSQAVGHFCGGLPAFCGGP